MFNMALFEPQPGEHEQKEQQTSSLALQLLPLVYQKYLTESSSVAGQEFGMTREEMITESFEIADQFMDRRKKRIEEARKKDKAEQEEGKEAAEAHIAGHPVQDVSFTIEGDLSDEDQEELWNKLKKDIIQRPEQKDEEEEK